MHIPDMVYRPYRRDWNGGYWGVYRRRFCGRVIFFLEEVGEEGVAWEMKYLESPKALSDSIFRMEGT
jgi:hypothetical protein